MTSLPSPWASHKAQYTHVERIRFALTDRLASLVHWYRWQSPTVWWVRGRVYDARVALRGGK